MKKVAILVLAFMFSVANAIAETLTFDWGDRDTLVEETINKKGNTFKASYLIKSKKEGDSYLISQHDVVVLSIDGRSTEGLPQSMFAQVTTAFVMPQLRVDLQGAPIEILNFEQFLDQMIKLNPDPRFESFIKSPQMIAIMEAKAIENWCYWVCNWLDPRLSLQKPLIETDTVEVAGMVLPQKSEVRLEPSPSSKNNVELTMKTLVGGEEATKALTEFTKKMIDDNQLTVTDSFDESSVNNFERADTLNLTTNPNTLFPVAVKLETNISMSMGNGQKKQQSESKSFVFKPNISKPN